ncbi:MAG: hypothetical protein WCT37_03110 [Patescibacteria group bacterium]|jgi:hypothetical protein
MPPEKPFSDYFLPPANETKEAKDLRRRAEIERLFKEKNELPSTYQRPAAADLDTDLAIGPDGEPTKVRKSKNPEDRFGR